MNPVLGAGPDEILDEVHAPAGANPAPIDVGVVRLDDDVDLEQDFAVEGKIPKRREPSRGCHQLVSDDQSHRDFGFSKRAAKFDTRADVLSHREFGGAAGTKFAE